MAKIQLSAHVIGEQHTTLIQPGEFGSAFGHMTNEWTVISATYQVSGPGFSLVRSVRLGASAPDDMEGWLVAGWNLSQQPITLTLTSCIGLERSAVAFVSV